VERLPRRGKLPGHPHRGDAQYSGTGPGRGNLDRRLQDGRWTHDALFDGKPRERQRGRAGRHHRKDRAESDGGRRDVQDAGRRCRREARRQEAVEFAGPGDSRPHFRMPRPTITTERLVLRPFTPADAPAVQRLASERAIAASTLLIPHPYPEGAAAEWIAGHDDTSNNHIFAITPRDGGEAMGAIGLHV